MAEELFQSASTHLNFEKFINTINKEQARDLVRSINIFMKKFKEKKPDPDQDSKEVQNFLASMESAFIKHPVYVGASQDDIDAACEGLEKYLMARLYDDTFAVAPADKERDQNLAARLSALQFITPSHLDVPAELAADGALLLAVKELKKMNMFRSPREKLVCILNCCRVINNLLTSRKYGAGADDFTPVVIYVTIKAAPEQLASNLAFIERYRAANRLISEAQYFFTQMQGAATFIETLTAQSLNIDPDEFLAHMLNGGVLTDADLASLPPKNNSPSMVSGGTAPIHAQSYGNPTVQTASNPGLGAPESSQSQLYGHNALLGVNPSTGFAAQGQSQPQPYVNSTTVEVGPVAESGFQGSIPFQSYGNNAAMGLAPSTHLPVPGPPQSYGGSPTVGVVPSVGLGAPASGLPQSYGGNTTVGLGAPAPVPPQAYGGNPTVGAVTQAPASRQSYGGSPAVGGAPNPAVGAQALIQPQSYGGNLNVGAALGNWGAPRNFYQEQLLEQQQVMGFPAMDSRQQYVPKPPKSVAELEAEGITLVVRAEAGGELSAKYRFLYMLADQLTVRDSWQLLSDYKELVLKYEMLAQAVENNVIRHYVESEAHAAAQMTQPSIIAAYPTPPPPPPTHLPYQGISSTIPNPYANLPMATAIQPPAASMQFPNPTTIATNTPSQFSDSMNMGSAASAQFPSSFMPHAGSAAHYNDPASGSSSASSHFRTSSSPPVEFVTSTDMNQLGDGAEFINPILSMIAPQSELSRDMAGAAGEPPAHSQAIGTAALPHQSEPSRDVTGGMGEYTAQTQLGGFAAPLSHHRASSEDFSPLVDSTIPMAEYRSISESVPEPSAETLSTLEQQPRALSSDMPQLSETSTVGEERSRNEDQEGDRNNIVEVAAGTPGNLPEPSLELPAEGSSGSAESQPVPVDHHEEPAVDLKEMEPSGADAAADLKLEELLTSLVPEMSSADSESMPHNNPALLEEYTSPVELEQLVKSVSMNDVVAPPAEEVSMSEES